MMTDHARAAFLAFCAAADDPMGYAARMNQQAAFMAGYAAREGEK